MGTIEEVMDDVKKTIGDKGFLVLIVGVALIFIYNLSKGSGNDTGTVNVTALTSYPDAVTNANVIIDTLQKSIDYSEGEIKDEIQGLDNSMKDYLDQHFTATNDFINTGIESNQILMEQIGGEIMGGIEGINTSIGFVNDRVDSLGSTVSGLQSTVGGLSSSVSGLQSSMGGLQGAVDSMKQELNKPATTTKPTTSTTTQYYTYKTKSGLNTNTSIVDALKATGVDSSMANRTAIAKANGISNYTGSYSQNVTLLNKLKSGTLKKV